MSSTRVRPSRRSAEPYVDPNDFVKITKASTCIDTRRIRVQEYEEAVQILHPSFRASCELNIKASSLDETQLNFSVGFVQFVKARRCSLEYSTGRACWEFNGFKTGDAILDADGSRKPFYGCKKEVLHIRGPIEEDRRERIEMVDQPSIKSSWNLELFACGLPGPSPTGSVRPMRLYPKLKSILRDQSFVTCVVLWDHVRDVFSVLRAYEWSLKLEVLVDVSLRVGSRARVISSAKDLYAQPRRKTKTQKLLALLEFPDSSFDVTANDSDTLVWRHKRCLQPVTIVKSKAIRDDLRTKDGIERLHSSKVICSTFKYMN
eukprot:m.25312 g.25312  ORF g.25312 m.25312 type:complete len:318 (+) comp28776_c0_seq1:945-1898(+)